MAVRSRRIFGPTQVAAAASATLYTVPAGRTAVFRLITLANNAGAVADLRIGIGGLTNALTIWRGPVNSQDFRQVLQDLVLNPGDQLQAQATTSAVTLGGYGSLLLGEPE